MKKSVGPHSLRDESRESQVSNFHNESGPDNDNDELNDERSKYRELFRRYAKRFIAKKDDSNADGDLEDSRFSHRRNDDLSGPYSEERYRDEYEIYGPQYNNDAADDDDQDSNSTEDYDKKRKKKSPSLRKKRFFIKRNLRKRSIMKKRHF